MKLENLLKEVKQMEKHAKSLELENKELKNKIELAGKTKSIINLDFWHNHDLKFNRFNKIL